MVNPGCRSRGDYVPPARQPASFPPPVQSVGRNSEEGAASGKGSKCVTPFINSIPPLCPGMKWGDSSGVSQTESRLSNHAPDQNPRDSAEGPDRNPAVDDATSFDKNLFKVPGILGQLFPSRIFVSACRRRVRQKAHVFRSTAQKSRSAAETTFFRGRDKKEEEG